MRKNPLQYAVIILASFILLGVTACSNSVPIPETTPSLPDPVEEPESVPTPEPSEPLPPQPELDPDSQIISLASASRLFSSVMPPEFDHASLSTTVNSAILGDGNAEYFYKEWPAPPGSISSNYYCQIQCILWVIDNDTAQQTTPEEIFEEYRLEGSHINLEDSAQAAISNRDYPGLNFLVIKYGKIFVMLNSYCSPLEGIIDTATAVKELTSQGEVFPTFAQGDEDCASLTDIGKVVVQHLKGYSQ